MVWVNGIGYDALARMESVGAFWRKRLSRFAARRGFGFRSFHFHQREIGDGAGPRELGLIEFVKMNRCAEEPRGRRAEKNDVRHARGSDRGADDLAADRAGC